MTDWYWLGAPLAMDFANTTHRRGPVDLEMLREPADLAEWVRAQRDESVPRVDDWAAAAARAAGDAEPRRPAGAAGRPGKGADTERPGPRDAGTTLAQVRALRDDVQRVLHAVVGGRPLPDDAVDRVNAAARAVPLVAQLRDGRTVLEPAAAAPAIDELLARVASSTIEIAGGACDVAFCDAPGCGGFFEPTRANQVWCSNACGTRARVARHAARH